MHMSRCSYDTPSSRAAGFTPGHRLFFRVGRCRVIAIQIHNVVEFVNTLFGFFYASQSLLSQCAEDERQDERLGAGDLRPR